MFKDTPEGVTHCICNKRMAEKGGNAECCFCEPHLDCELIPIENEDELEIVKYYHA